MTTSKSGLVFVIASVSLLACGDGDPLGPSCSTFVDPVVTVDTTTGEQPVINWTGDQVSYLSVWDEDSNAMWQLRGDLVPPVTYGEIGNSNGTEDSPSVPLVSGTIYSAMASQSCQPVYDDNCGDDQSPCYEDSGQVEATFTMP